MLNNVSFFLDMNFVDTLDENLPKDQLENSIVGLKYMDTEVQSMVNDGVEKLKTKIKHENNMSYE